MAKPQRRKLFLFGRYSLALLPPKKWLREMGVERGDEVTLTYSKSKRRIVIQIDPEQNLIDLAKKTPEPKTPKKGKDKSDPEDWQPIPQL